MLYFNQIKLTFSQTEHRNEANMIKKLLTLLLLLALPLGVLAGDSLDLTQLSAQELEVIRAEAAAEILLRQLPDKDGYLDALDGESYARTPDAKMGEKARFSGDVLSVELTEDAFRYLISLENNPRLVFSVNYAQETDEDRILPGDSVTVHAVFEGISAYNDENPLLSGAPSFTADLIVRKLDKADEDTLGTRGNPVPLNTTVTYEGTYWSSYASFEFEVTNVKRGFEAQKLVKDMSKYNITPLKTQEYYVIWLRVKALSAPNGRAPLSQEDFRFVSADGREYRQQFLINPTSYLQTIYEGTEYTAVVSTIIDKGDTPTLVYQPQSAAPLWFNPNTGETP